MKKIFLTIFLFLLTFNIKSTQVEKKTKAEAVLPKFTNNKELLNLFANIKNNELQNNVYQLFKDFVNGNLESYEKQKSNISNYIKNDNNDNIKSLIDFIEKRESLLKQFNKEKNKIFNDCDFNTKRIHFILSKMEKFLIKKLLLNNDCLWTDEFEDQDLG